MTVRDTIREILRQEFPEAPAERVERAVERIVTVVDPFERVAADVLQRYDGAFAKLANNEEQV